MISDQKSLTSEPTENWKIPLYKVFTDDEDLKIVERVIKRGSMWAMGPEIEELENGIQEYLGIDYCTVLNSGTSALHALLIANEIKQNDEVIVPSFSFISTANSVLFVNADPVFADIEEETFGLNPQLINEKITAKTKAIIPMDYGGMSCKINEIKDIAKSNNITLIEDAAEGLGSKVEGKKVGTVSTSAIFSFCGNKVLTTGEGGAVITKDKKIDEKIKAIRSHGRIDKNYFENPFSSQYLDVGYNWRMSSITAALGVSQLQKLDKLIEMRQKNAKFISSKLKKFSQVMVPTPPKNFEHIYQMYTIRLKDKSIRDKLQKFLLGEKIFSKIYFLPIHLFPFYKEHFHMKKGMLPITEKVSEEILTLPMYPNMTNEEKSYLTSALEEFFEDLK